MHRNRRASGRSNPRPSRKTAQTGAERERKYPLHLSATQKRQASVRHQFRDGELMGRNMEGGVEVTKGKKTAPRLSQASPK